MPDAVISEILNRMRRARRNGERLHLEQAHIRALMQPRIYAVLTEIEAEEFDQCVDQEDGNGEPEPTPAPRRGSSSAASGSGTAPTATTGTSVGLQAVPRAESQLVLEAAAMVARRSKQKKRSPATSSNGRPLRLAHSSPQA